METTIVFSMRSLTTLPTRSFRRFRTGLSIVSVMRLHTSLGRAARACAGRVPSGLGGLFLLLEDREQARHLAPPLADLQRIVELLHGIAEAQVEQLLAQLRDAAANLVHRLLAQRSRLHLWHRYSPRPSSCRSTKRVRIGSLDAPS